MREEIKTSLNASNALLPLSLDLLFSLLAT